MTSPESHLHPHLLRQLRGIGAQLGAQPTEDQWRELLSRVSEIYTEDDRERRLQDHAWEVSSQELHDLHLQLAESSASDLALQRDRLSTVLETTNTGLCLIDEHRNVVEVNQAGAAFLRSERDAALGLNVLDLLWPTDRRSTESAPIELRLAISQRRGWTGDSVVLRLAPTRTATCMIVYTPLTTDDAVDNGGLIAFHDLTSVQRAAEDVAWRESHDALTGLFNRTAITAFMDGAINSVADPNRRRAVLFVDLDRFKNINDMGGHDIGDIVLVETASRIRNALRNDDVVARLGGDEFVVFLDSIPGGESVRSISERILASLRLPFRVAGQLLHLSASIGYTVTRDRADSASKLMRDADIALYRAKSAGRDQAIAFDEDLRASVELQVSLDRELRTAVSNDELTVAFQPIVDMRTRQIVGFETLARWDSSEGPISPELFIPLAEENGLITTIGRMALTEALSLANESGGYGDSWPTNGRLVAVNVSGVQLTRGGFAALVARSLAEADVPPSALMVELTESTLMTHGDNVLTELNTLRGMGVHIAIDDFGTGWSSLSMLQQFPIDCIKIDRSFVSSMATNRDDAAIVRAVVELGRTLGHSVIAEGVETQEQAEALLMMGCTLAQGYLYARPADRSTALSADLRHAPVIPHVSGL